MPELDENGNIIKDDVHDVGVPMKPAPTGYTHQGPEDAYDPGARGDYRDRIAGGPHVQIVRDPETGELRQRRVG